MSDQKSWSIPGVKEAVGGAVVLGISLFLPWWDQPGGFGDLQEAATGSSMVNAFEVSLIALVVLACAIGVIITAMRVGNTPSLAAGGFGKSGVIGLGVVAALAVVVGIASPPEPTAVGQSLGDPATPTFGIWIALVASLVIVYGGRKISTMQT